MSLIMPLGLCSRVLHREFPKAQPQGWDQLSLPSLESSARFSLGYIIQNLSVVISPRAEGSSVCT